MDAPDTPQEATEQAARDHVSNIFFSPMDVPEQDCLLCKTASELGLWAEWGEPDPLTGGPEAAR